MDLRHAVLHLLPLRALACILATSNGWRGFADGYVSSLHVADTVARWLFSPEGHVRLAALRQRQVALVVGGYDSRWNDGDTGCGMDDGPGCLQSAEPVCCLRPPYAEAAPTWLALPDLQRRRADVAVVAASSGTVYAVGGREGVVPHRSVEVLKLPLWQLRRQGWQEAGCPPMRERRSGLVAAAVHGALVAAGGCDSIAAGDIGHELSSAEILRIGNTDGGDGGDGGGEWSALPPMHCSRVYAASAVLNDGIYVLGGRSSPHSAEMLDLGGQTWLQLPSLLGHRFSASEVTYRGRIVVFGGAAPGPAEVFDPREGVWKLAAWEWLHAHGCLVGSSAVIDGDTLYIMGGMNPHAVQGGLLPERPDCSSQVVRIFDMRYAGAGAAAPASIWGEPPPSGGPPPPPGIAMLRSPRWCGGVCVTSMAC